jgi:putative hydrolase of the HAD superfamily
MKKAIIFDLNGVFIISPRLSERFESDFNVPSDEFMPVLQDIMDKVRRPGAENTYTLWKPYLDKWKINFFEKEFLNYWFSAEKENMGLIDLARSLKEKGYKLIILSNNFRERADYYDKTFPFIRELFDGVYYSWQTGFVKPDVRAFENILENHNLKPIDCLYFDDSGKNIQLANSIGIESYIFDSKAINILNSLIS